MGIEEVRADDVIAPVADYEVEYYEVVKGDSLWKIADKFYGDGSKYKQILAENLQVIKDPDLIFPGQKIRIPSID
jgi:nucleoid-associated protein YgaU